MVGVVVVAGTALAAAVVVNTVAAKALGLLSRLVVAWVAVPGMLMMMGASMSKNVVASAAV